MKSGHFEPQKFEDEYENALKELLKKKQAGQPAELPERREPARVINLMEALRQASRRAGRPGNEWRTRSNPGCHGCDRPVTKLHQMRAHVIPTMIGELDLRI